MIKLSKAKPIKLACNNLRVMDFDCKDEQGTIALFMWFILEITLVFDKEPWCQTVFSFTNKRLGKGNVPQ